MRDSYKQLEIYRIWSLFFMIQVLLKLTGCSSEISKISNVCIKNAPGFSATAMTGDELNELQLALIFVQGPSEVTDDIGIFLRENDISATFFAQGSRISEFKAILHEVNDNGHLIGNNGYSGQSLINSKSVRTEIRATDRLILPFIKGNMFLMSPPKFQYNSRVRQLLNQEGLIKYAGPIIPLVGQGNEFFLFDEQCWLQDFDASACTQNYLDEIRRVEKGIVAFSDVDVRTLEMLEQMIPVLKNEGYSFLRIDQIPSIYFALQSNGATPTINEKTKTCNDYQ